MRRRVRRGGAPPDELLDVVLWCERRGLTGHLDGEAWNDGSVDAWLDARRAWAEAHGWPGVFDAELEGCIEASAALPNAPFHPEWI